MAIPARLGDGTPASISDMLLPQTLAIDDEPFELSTSDTRRIV